MKKKKRGGWAASVMAKIVPIMKLVFLALPRVLVFFWEAIQCCREISGIDVRIHHSGLCGTLAQFEV